MKKQVFFSFLVLLILVVSQIVWIKQLWDLDRKRLRNELTTELSGIVNYQNLKKSFGKGSSGSGNAQIRMREVDKKTVKNPLIVGEIDTHSYGADKSFAKMVEDAFMDFALEANKIKVSFVDSVFRKSYPRLNEVAYYSLKLTKKEKTTDSVFYGKKPLFTPIHIKLPLGSKKTTFLTADFRLKTSGQLRKMLYSIGITAIAMILTGFLIAFQLIQLRNLTVVLEWRKKLVSGVVHDLKSPLAYVYTLLGFFETTEKDILKTQSFHTAKTRIKFLSEKTELLLSSFKADNNKFVINVTAYHFTERCRDIMEELKTIYSDKNVQYTINTPPDLTINADSVYFEGCIRNLLDNAVKYSPDYNTEVIISAVEKNGKIFLSFKDNGSGIPAKMRKKVFKEFYRYTPTMNIKGYGVGLAFTKQIVEAHKGIIYIEKQDKSSEGTTFTIVLPK